MPAEGGEGDLMLARFADAGVDVAALAERLQREGAKAFVAAWKDLLDRISTQRTALTR